MSKEIGPTPRERCLAMLRYVTGTVNAMHGDDVDADQERALTACSVALVQACNALEFVCGRDPK